eukprot:7001161-Prymnesium_polylepis.1
MASRSDAISDSRGSMRRYHSGSSKSGPSDSVSSQGAQMSAPSPPPRATNACATAASWSVVTCSSCNWAE